MSAEVSITLVMAVHLAWIVFMLAGVFFTAAAFFRKSLFDLRLFRRVHLAGMVFTAVLAAAGEPCPLTRLENRLRSASSRGPYEGPFLARHLERIIYPDVPAAAITVPTVLAGMFVAAVYMARPPRRRRRRR